MASWFRPGLPPYQAALAMIGAKAGDRVTIVSASDPGLAAEVALVTGLNGETTVVDERAGAETTIAAAAAQSGTLVEFVRTRPTATPFEAGSRDIVALVACLHGASADERLATVREALRVLRTGGRVVVLEGARRTGPLAALRGRTPKLSNADVLGLLDQPDTKARRHLGDAEGVSYYEARKI